ncbi:hypothetical protein V6259_17210 [Marinomonas sp. TI.3.20]|uniref:hypothetical protein n=1 Tax=Marinomonas sp. TI.3.20 TaxID=3121296 RepID=UPI00311E527A
MHNLYAQPNLSQVTTHKRFKGCYLLESVKAKITDTGWPVRIATIKDVQDHNTIELRLLGNQFLAINHFVGDYLQLEAAIKRYRNGQFFYLAWYEPVTGLLMEPVKKEKDAVHQLNRESCLQAIRQHIQFLPSLPEQSFCLNVINKFGHNISSYALQKLCKQLSNLTDSQFIVELACQAEKQNDDIASIGKTLDQLSSKQAYHIWEQRLLGN